MAKIGAHFSSMSAKGLIKHGQSNDRIKHILAFRELETPQAKLAYLESNRPELEKCFDNVDKLVSSWKCQ